MKTLATEIKVGQEIKFGNQWGKVTHNPVPNGRANEVDIRVITLPCKIRRKDGNVTVYNGGYPAEYTYRKTTMVQTR